MNLMSKPIILLDFDGVIHSYASGWQGVDNIPDPPVPGVFEWMEEALEYFDIAVYSARSESEDGRKAMFDYIMKHASGDLAWSLDFPATKPRAFITIDDRCICFNGNWADPQHHPKTLLEFKPWYKSVTSKTPSSGT